MNKLVTEMIREGCIDHGHFEFGNIHTDNFVKDNFIFKHEIANEINLRAYNLLKDITFEEILALDTTGLIIAYPLSLMFKCNLFNIKKNNGEVTDSTVIKNTVAIASIIRPETFEVISQNLRGITKIIICLVNYSGNKFINGTQVIDLIDINTWKSNDCPYCKDNTNE